MLLCEFVLAVLHKTVAPAQTSLSNLCVSNAECEWVFVIHFAAVNSPMAFILASVLSLQSDRVTTEKAKEVLVILNTLSVWNVNHECILSDQFLFAHSQRVASVHRRLSWMPKRCQILWEPLERLGSIPDTFLFLRKENIEGTYLSAARKCISYILNGRQLGQLLCLVEIVLPDKERRAFPFHMPKQYHQHFIQL
jgi:hypothetical protein